MCGIAGVYHYRGGVPDRTLLERQTAALAHRGPDDGDVWIEGPVGFGHRRLAIVDLSPGGHQPMANEDGSLTVTYNGELYGWPELREELAGRGHRFRGASDTEALLHLYEERGVELFDRLRGMFAFGLWDRPRARLLLARDRLGIKPLYWHDDGRRLAFASELKALMLDPAVPREVDPGAVADYLTFQYVPQPATILRGVAKLPQGHRLICDPREGTRVEPYWSLPVGAPAAVAAEDPAARLRELLAEAVRIRMVADVPVGAFLSGGIDSSVVVAFMARASSRPVCTFSIGFEDAGVSELDHARRVARHLGTDHHEHVVRPHALEDLPRMVWGMDEPFADASMIPTFYVSEMARRHVTVALSGDGGDEAYAGYATYRWALRNRVADRIPASARALLRATGRALGRDAGLGRRLHRAGLGTLGRHLEGMAVVPPHALPGLLGPALRGAVDGRDPFAAARALHAGAARSVGDVPALLHLDALTYMADDVLAKVDRMSMQHALEVRVPLLDHRVIEHVAALPFGLKLRGRTTKWILREAARDLLPAETLARGKQGFGVPLDAWFGRGFGRLAREVLLDPRCRARGWLDPRGVERLIAGTGADPDKRTRRIWALVCLELWAQCFLDRPAAEVARPAGPPSANRVA
jgi:asparagine synthase (glutamine-hydrolysing)